MPNDLSHTILHTMQKIGVDVIIPEDFTYLADLDTIKSVMTTLVARASLLRLCDNIYCLPNFSSYMNRHIKPDPDQIAAALGRSLGHVVSPSPASIENRLGRSTQVPAKLVYITDGPSRELIIGGEIFILKHVQKCDIDPRWIIRSKIEENK